MTEFLAAIRERGSWIAETSFAVGGTMTGGEVIGYDWTCTPDFSQGWQEYLTAGADDFNVAGRVPGPLKLPYVMEFIPANWRWLKYLMTVANGDDGGIKTHTFTQNASVDTWRFEWAKRHTTPHVLTIIGNFCKSATIRFSKATGEGSEGFLKVKMDCTGQNISQGSSVTTITAGNLSTTPPQYRMVKWTLNTTEIKEVNNGEITMSLGINEADARHCNSTYSNLIGEPAPGVFRISGRFNINIKDKSFYDLWAAKVVVPGINTFLIDIDGTGDDQLLMTFTRFVIHKSVAPTRTGLDGVTNVDIIWTADAFTSLVSRDAITTY